MTDAVRLAEGLVKKITGLPAYMLLAVVAAIGIAYVSAAGTKAPASEYAYFAGLVMFMVILWIGWRRGDLGPTRAIVDWRRLRVNA